MHCQGGVDSSVVTMLAHKALGKKLKTYFINNGIMREGEPERVASIFAELEVDIEVIDAREEFFSALKGITDPEEKREAITQTFYKHVFGRPGVRKLAKFLGLPEEIYDRAPFPGPALAARVIGEATPERIETVRKATAIVEEELKGSGAFQYLAILHKDKVTGMRNGKRDFGNQIEIRCWESKDARTGTPTELPYKKLFRISGRIVNGVPGVVSVTYNITSKPPSTIEAV